MPTEIGHDLDTRDIYTTPVVNPTMVHSSVPNVSSHPVAFTTENGPSSTSEQPQLSSSSQENETDGLKIVEQSYRARGLSTGATSIILSSWRDGSRKQYSSYLKRWVQFCSQRQIDPLRAPVTHVLDFLTELYNTGLGYTAINTARSAISSILLSTGAVSFGSHPLVVRFFRGVYNARPSLPRYTEIWDVRSVLDKLREMPPAYTLALKELTYKLVMLIALVSAQRGQTIHLLNIKNMTKTESSYSFTITELTKTKKPGHKADIITLMTFTPDIRLCVYHWLEKYIQRTEKLRSDDGQLFISFNKPHNKVSRETVCQWIKNVMVLAGIDANIFKPHSTRSASTSATAQAEQPLHEIMKVAGWKSDCTFAKYYDKTITE